MRVRLSPGLVVAIAALFVALGGGAYALSGHDTVFSDDIVNGEVRDADVADPPVRAVKPNPLIASDPCASGQTGVFCGFFDNGPSDGNWENVGVGYGHASFYRGPDGTVHLSGVATINSYQSTLRVFILPAGYRPAATQALATACWTSDLTDYGDCLVTVEKNGEVRWEDGQFPRSGMSLDAISFRAR